MTIIEKGIEAITKSIKEYHDMDMALTIIRLCYLADRTGTFKATLERKEQPGENNKDK